MPASFLLQPDVDTLYDKEHDHSNHNRASAIADKRKRYSCQGNKLDTSPYSEKNLENIHDPNAIYDQLIKTIPDLNCNMHHHHKTTDHDQNQTNAKDYPQFLAYR